jgi:hypothetical protein
MGPLLKAKISKVDYSSKDKGSNVRGVGTFFDTFLNLGQLHPCIFKSFIKVFISHEI